MKMIDKEIKEIDLTDYYVVLGSGLSAVSTIHGIHDSQGSAGKKIIVIDAGLTEESNPTFAKMNNNYKSPSPKFKIKANQYVYKSFKSMLDVTEEGFEVVGSLAKGGLSNIWGAGIQPYTDKELFKFPYTFDEIKHIYSKIYKILTGSKNKIFLDSKVNNRNFVISDPLLAINKKWKNLNNCHLKTCNDGCISCNKNIFNSKYEIDDLIKLDKIEYLPGLFIESISWEGDHYIIKCLEIISERIIFIKASVIYSSLGPVSTSKIVLEMTGKKDNLPLLSTPGGSLFIFSLKDFHKGNHSILSSKTFTSNLNAHSFEGNIFPFSENLVSTYFGNSIGKVLNYFFRNLIFSKLFIANVYFDSDMSQSRIKYEDKNLKIESTTTAKLKKIFKSALVIIKKEFLIRGLLVIPFSYKLLLPGQDIHYGGTIPMKKNPKKNQCNFNGQLQGFKNFYITDASALPYLAAKGQSFNSMVNAYYIASKSVSAEE